MKINSIKLSDLQYKKLLLLFAFVGLVLRIVFVVATPQIGSPEAMDSGTYHSIAVNLIEGRGYSEDGVNPSIFVAPFFPFFLAFLYKLFGVHPMLAEVVQCFFNVGIALLTFLIANRFFSSIVAFIAFVIVLFLPDLFVLPTFLYTETVFIFLFMLLIWTTLRAIDRPSFKRIFIAAFVCGLATLTRGVTMLFPVVFFLALLPKFGFLKSVRLAAVFALFFALSVLPWTVRNYVTFHAFVPIAVGTGDVFWTGNYLPFDGKYNYEKTMQLMDEMTEGLNQIERDKRLMQEAKKNIAAAPLQTAVLMGKKFFRFWLWVYEAGPTGQKRQSNFLVQFVLSVAYYPILLLFMIGVWITRERWRDLSLFYWLLSYYVALHVVMLVVPRYRIPILPIMSIFAAVALVWLFQLFVDKKGTILSAKRD